MIFKTPAGEAAFMAAYEAALGRWPAPHEDFYLPTRFGATYVMASGPGQAPPLLLLSGAGTGSTIWRTNAAGLSQRFRTYAVDTPGDAGKSASGSIRTRHDCGCWLGDVLHGLGVDRAHFAGISYGAWLAMNMAVLAPERVMKAVLVAPAASFVPLGPMFYTVYFSIVMLPYRPVVRAVLRMLSAKGGGEFDRWAEQMYFVVRHCRLQRVPPTVFSDGELGRCAVPVLVMAGEKENLYDLDAALSRAEKLLPDVKTEVVPDAGHVVNLDQPEKVNDRILSFLADLSHPAKPD